MITTRKVAFFFIEVSTINQTPTRSFVTTSMQVRFQYFDDDIETHLDAYGRFTYGTRNHCYIIKRPNIAIVDVPFTTGRWFAFDTLCKSICAAIQHNFHPFKPISHFSLADYPEALL